MPILAMASLYYKKQCNNSDVQETGKVIKKTLDTCYPNVYFLLNLSELIKSDGHLIPILINFSITTLKNGPDYQISKILP